MLKCVSVYTYEIDDADAALDEIKAQLDEITLLKHTAGIIMCHPEFTVSETLKYVCDNLPFDIAGVTTSSQAVNGEAGELMLSIFVMTSDDVWFKVGTTEKLDGEVDTCVKDAYEKISAGESEVPKLAIIFPPFLFKDYAGDEYTSAWDKLLPQTPVFGTIAVDDTITYTECETIFNGVNTKDTMPFILCYGNINPRFIIATLPENDTIAINAAVTKANRNFIYEINGMNARAFFADSAIPEGMLHATPFKINRNKCDNVAILRSFASFSEDGSAMFDGYVDEGSTFSLLNCTTDDILSSSLEKCKQVDILPDTNGILLFSCCTRRTMLSGLGQRMEELELAKKTIKAPFMMGYSGGEICPTSINNAGGKPANAFHNFSVVILAI